MYQVVFNCFQKKKTILNNTLTIPFYESFEFISPKRVVWSVFKILQCWVQNQLSWSEDADVWGFSAAIQLPA